MPRNHAEQNPASVQGSFFEEQVTVSAVTDPLMREETRQLVLRPEGVYPDEPEVREVVIDQPEVVEAVHKAVVSQNRHKGNANKHSALDTETGQYSTTPKVGSYLPDFGPVTYTNYDDAVRHATRLNAKLK